MKKTLLSAAIVGALAISGAAYATQINNGGFYVGVSGGLNGASMPSTTALENDVLGSPGVTQVSGTIKDSGYYLNAHMGYLFPIVNRLAIGPQIGYSYYGENKISISRTVFGTQQSATETQTVESVNFLAVAKFNFTQDWFITANGGIGRFFNDVQLSGPSLSNRAQNNLDAHSPDTWEAMAGASVGYDIYKGLSLSVNYEHIFGADNDNSPLFTKAPKMDLLGLGLTYTF